MYCTKILELENQVDKLSWVDTAVWTSNLAAYISSTLWASNPTIYLMLKEVPSNKPISFILCRSTYSVLRPWIGPTLTSTSMWMRLLKCAKKLQHSSGLRGAMDQWLSCVLYWSSTPDADIQIQYCSGRRTERDRWLPYVLHWNSTPDADIKIFGPSNGTTEF